MKRIRMGLIGDHNDTHLAHRAIPHALEVCASAAKCGVEPVWLDTVRCETERLEGFDAFWCVPASPYRSMEGALRAIRFAREKGQPFLGTCGGFQHALIEYARNVLGLRSADHAETNPGSSCLIISPLKCSLVEGRGIVLLTEGSRLRELYDSKKATEMYHCSYGLNRAFESKVASEDLRFSARDEGGEVRAFELTNHPFYVGTLFQPERSDFLRQVHPIIYGFMKAAMAAAA